MLFTLFMIGRAIWQFSKDDMVAVPNLTGKTSAEAEIELANLSISVSFSYQPNDTVAEGVVYGQSVSPDTPVAPKTLVTVYVSSGPEKINVPSVCNMSIAEAEARLDEAGLELGTTSFQPNTEEIEGTVIRQVPAAGETVAKGSEVNLVIVSNQTPTGTAVPGE
ncbi:MAG: PASTA domain-containing protein [Christensenellales bacterium]